MTRTRRPASRGRRRAQEEAHMARARSRSTLLATAGVGLLVAATAVPTGAQSPSAAASVPAAPAIPPGTTVNLLTFNGPQVAEPLIRRAPDFEKLTGIHV